MMNISHRLRTLPVFSCILVLCIQAYAGQMRLVYPPPYQLPDLRYISIYPTYKTIQEALNKCKPGDQIQVAMGEGIEEGKPARYSGDLRIATPNIRLGGTTKEGATIEGTITINAPGVTLWDLTIIADKACIIIGPDARDCKIQGCRLVVRTDKGVALDVLGPNAGNTQVLDTLIYTPGVYPPVVRPNDVSDNLRRFERAGVGIRIRGEAGNDNAFIHHCRVAGYETGLWLGDEQSRSTRSLKARIWKNSITANTTGIKILGGDCLVEDNDVMRNTGAGIVAHGPANRIVRNRILDGSDVGMDLQGAWACNNVLSGNRGGALTVSGGTKLLNNTLHGNRGLMLGFSDRSNDPGDKTGVLFVNNLVDHCGELFEIGDNVDRHHNVYANGAVPQRLGTRSKSGKCAYQDMPRRDYRPTPDSIAVDVGVIIENLGRDRSNSGRKIGKAPDAGAFEVGPSRSAGRQWWVAPDGNDAAGDGSNESPFRTLTRAGRDAGPDDFIYFKAGEYKEKATITCAGSEGHPVTIRPAPGVAHAVDLVTLCVARKKIEMNNSPTGKAVVVNSNWRFENASHVVLEGIEFRDCTDTAIVFADRAGNNIVRRCLFVNCPTSNPKEGAGWAAGITGGLESSDILIEGNIFDRRPNTDYYHREVDVINPGDQNWAQRWIFRNNKVAGYDKLQLGAALPSPTYHLIENNEFFECNRAVHVKTSHNIIRGNHVHDLIPKYVYHTVGMMDRGGRHNIYEGNRVEGCTYAGVLLLADDHIVRNNIFDRCDTGILVAMREFGASPGRKIHVHHNTLVNCIRGVQLDASCSAYAYNNIIYRSPEIFKSPSTVPAFVADNYGIPAREKYSWQFGRRGRFREPAVLRADYNLYFNTEPAYLRYWDGGLNDIYADPMFVDPARKDYRLLPGSPARGSGRSLDVGHDLAGRPRPLGNPDIGAFQFQD